MIIAIIGSRGFKDMSKLEHKIQDIRYGGYNPNEITIISGGANGVDKTAIWLAEKFGLKTNDKDYLPDFKQGIPACYHIRNDKIINDAHRIIAFWDGKSPGTKSVIEKALARRKDVEVVFD